MKNILWRSCMAVVVLCGLLSVNISYAETTQQNIEDAKNEISNIQNKKDEAEKEADNISNKKEEIEKDIGNLNEELKRIVSDANELEQLILEKEEEIAAAKLELAAAERQCEQQYEDMKLRIQFMYENSTRNTWEKLLDAASLLDFLNRTEYITKITNYDRSKLTEFENLQQELADKKTQLEADMEELLAMQEKLKQNQSRINGLISTAQANLAQANEALANAQENIEELEEKLVQMIEYERQLEIQKAREDAARMEEIKRQEQEDTSGVVYVPADSDAYLLGAIIQCEADGEPYSGKLAVGSVVLNRVKSSYFPNTVSGVIYQGGQFSPVASGRLAYRLEAGVNETCLQAAQEVLNGSITTNWLYFRTNTGAIQGMIIGNHVFY